MLKQHAAVAVIVIAGWSASLQAAAPNFKEGEWGVRYRMEVVGAPFPMPPITANKSMCLDGKNYVPDTTQEGQDCKVSDTRVTGDTVSWTLRCTTREGTIEGQGKITYRGERYDGTMDAKLVSAGNPGMPIHYRYTMEGQRLGNCKK
jgi:Protein of unknown function (DUF3617)